MLAFRGSFTNVEIDESWSETYYESYRASSWCEKLVGDIATWRRESVVWNVSWAWEGNLLCLEAVIYVHYWICGGSCACFCVLDFPHGGKKKFLPLVYDSFPHLHTHTHTTFIPPAITHPHPRLPSPPLPMMCASLLAPHPPHTFLIVKRENQQQQQKKTNSHTRACGLWRFFIIQGGVQEKKNLFDTCAKNNPPSFFLLKKPFFVGIS